MIWKQRPTWFKVLIIGVILVLLLSIPAVLCMLKCSVEACSTGCPIFTYLFLYPALIIIGVIVGLIMLLHKFRRTGYLGKIFVIIFVVCITAGAYYLFPKIIINELIIEFAIKIEDYKYCGVIGEQKARENCYYRIASQAVDLSVCDKIQTINTRESCYADIAVKTLDITICDQIVSDNSYGLGCYANIAKEKNDISICQRYLRPEEGRSTCLRMVVEN